MKNLQNILKEITEVTTNIETNYPELYSFLDENPLTLPANNHPSMNKKIMVEYLESLNQLVKHHLETHKKNTSK